jgi:hypothetical protein
MRVIAVLLILLGLAGCGMGSMMFGDIGIAAIIGATAAFLSGIGFWIVGGHLKSPTTKGASKDTVVNS